MLIVRGDVGAHQKTSIGWRSDGGVPCASGCGDEFVWGTSIGWSSGRPSVSDRGGHRCGGDAISSHQETSIGWSNAHGRSLNGGALRCGDDYGRDY